MIEGRDQYLHTSLINVKMVDWSTAHISELLVPVSYRARKMVKHYLPN
jgi:hypothetical protein